MIITLMKIQEIYSRLENEEQFEYSNGKFNLLYINKTMLVDTTEDVPLCLCAESKSYWGSELSHIKGLRFIIESNQVSGTVLYNGNQYIKDMSEDDIFNLSTIMDPEVLELIGSPLYYYNIKMDVYESIREYVNCFNFHDFLDGALEKCSMC